MGAVSLTVTLKTSSYRAGQRVHREGVVGSTCILARRNRHETREEPALVEGRTGRPVSARHDAVVLRVEVKLEHVADVGGDLVGQEGERDAGDVDLDGLCGDPCAKQASSEPVLHDEGDTVVEEDFGSSDRKMVRWCT